MVLIWAPILLNGVLNGLFRDRLNYINFQYFNQYETPNYTFKNIVSLTVQFFLW